MESMEAVFNEIDLLPSSRQSTPSGSGEADVSINSRLIRIEELAHKAKNSVRASWTSIEAINERLWDGATQVDKLKIQFDELDDRFIEIVELMTNIEMSSQFQATKCTSISEILHELGEYASHNVETSEFVAQSSAQLLKQTDGLKAVIAQLQNLTGLKK